MSALANNREKREIILLGTLRFITFLTLSLIALLNLGLAQNLIKLRVTAEQANIREKPDITSVILLQVQEGTILEAEKKEGEWYAVRIEQEGGGLILGYVHESLVIAVEPLPAEAPQKIEPIETKPVPEKQPPKKEKKEPHLPLPPPPAKPTPKPEARPPRFSLSLWWGGRLAGIGDLNDGAEGLAQFYAWSLGLPADGKIQKIHTGYIAGGEIQLPLGSGFYFAASATYFSSEASSTVTFGEKEPRPTYMTVPSVQVIPISLSIFFYPFRFFNLKAGLDYSLARASFLYRFENGGFWQKWKGKADAGALGYHYGAGIDLAISRHISLIIDGLYHRCVLTGLEGKGSYEESTGEKTTQRGRLYFFQAATTADETVPLLFLRDKEPSEPGVTDVREAELNLRGLSLRAGLRLKF